ncbi:hypothetical protein [Pseudonocardia adelaidensis]|uniref:Uncharacterized protein n=1 Tax=Pseudonocardia adelaidensis TaxID=648754 RepID=A0ABP9NBT8_9PSEU
MAPSTSEKPVRLIGIVELAVQEHFDAGADHVCIQVLTSGPAALPTREWRELAPALISGSPATSPAP